MADFLESELKALDAVVRKVPLGQQAGEQVDLPPVILAQVGDDPTKMTILCYGHYDVQPVRRCPPSSYDIYRRPNPPETALLDDRRDEKTGGILSHLL
jgi:hypothetical protein